MLNIKSFDIKRKRTESGSIDLASIIVGVTVIAVLLGGVVFASTQLVSYKHKAFTASNVEKIASSIQYLTMIDNMDEVLVENGGKLPDVSLAVNEGSDTATITVNSRTNTIELNTSTLYSIETTIDGYIIEAYEESSEDSKKTVLATRDLNIDEIKITK